MLNLWIVTQASNRVGTGHLVESINLAQQAQAEGINVCLLINESAPKQLIEQVPCMYKTFRSIYKEAGSILNQLKSKNKSNNNVLLFNCRKIENKILELANKDFKTICIDETGNRKLDCNVVINPTPISNYHSYTSSVNNFKLYTGPEYMILSKKIAELHNKKRPIKGSIKTLTVCMGGIDRSATTIRMIDILAEWDSKVKKNILLGSGFLAIEEVYEKVRSLNNSNFHIFQNVENIEDIFSQSDIVFTAGGNVIYELACTGTLPVVLYEDPHEKENGLAFQKMGFGMCLSSGKKIKKTDIFSTLEFFNSPTARQAYSEKGKSIVDGQGCKRVINLIRKTVKI